MQQTHAVFGELAHYSLQITDTNVTSLLKIMATGLVSNNRSVSELEVCVLSDLCPIGSPA